MSSHLQQPESGADYPEIVRLDRTNVILRISLALQARSRRRWRVRGGTGTEYGRLVIGSPLERREPSGEMTKADRAELGDLLGFGRPVDPLGLVVEDSYDHYREYIDRAEGRIPRSIAEPLPW